MHILEIFEREFSSRYLDIMKIQIALIVTDGQSIQEWIDSLCGRQPLKIYLVHSWILRLRWCKIWIGFVIIFGKYDFFSWWHLLLYDGNVFFYQALYFPNWGNSVTFWEKKNVLKRQFFFSDRNSRKAGILWETLMALVHMAIVSTTHKSREFFYVEYFIFRKWISC